MRFDRKQQNSIKQLSFNKVIIKKKTVIGSCAVLCLVVQSCQILCDPMDCSPPGSFVHEDSPDKNTQVGCHALLRGSSQSRDQTWVSHITGGSFTIRATREAQQDQRILLLLLLSRSSRVRLCATPEMAAHQAPPSLGFSRQEHWSGLPFPSPMHEGEK